MGSEAPEASADTTRPPTAATCMNMRKLPPYASEETRAETLPPYAPSGFDPLDVTSLYRTTGKETRARYVVGIGSSNEQRVRRRIDALRVRRVMFV